MKNLINRANSKISIGWAATLLSGSFFMSAILGLLRDRLLLANFGVGATLDAYYIAFSIPDFMFYLLVSGALSVTFIPVFSRRINKGNKKSAWELSSSLINLLSLVTFAASILIFIFAPQLVDIAAKGSDPETKQLSASLMRIIAVNPFVFSISNVLASMQQAVGRFFFNAMAPVIYNLGIIFGILFLAPQMGILGVAIGVAVGAISQLIFQLLGMVGIGFEYDWKIYWKNLGFRKVLRLLPARSVDQGIDYFNALIERFIASFFVAGAITAYQAAFTLRSVPITLIGVAISTAAFPKISERAATRSDLFRQDFVKVSKVILWLGLPSAAIAFFMRGYLVRLLLGQGNVLIAAILAWFTVSIVFRALFHSVTRAFYAQQDTSTPLYISIVTIALNTVLAFRFTEAFGITGLAMAQSASAVFEVTILVFILQRRYGTIIDFQFIIDSFKMLVATGFMSVITYISVSRIFPLNVSDTGFVTLAPKFLVIVLISALAYVFASFALNLKEAKPVVNSLAKLVFKPVKIE